MTQQKVVFELSGKGLAQSVAGALQDLLDPPPAA